MEVWMCLGGIGELFFTQWWYDWAFSLGYLINWPGLEYTCLVGWLI